jgi:hypothetical protein
MEPSLAMADTNLAQEVGAEDKPFSMIEID